MEGLLSASLESKPERVKMDSGMVESTVAEVCFLRTLFMYTSFNSAFLLGQRRRFDSFSVKRLRGVLQIRVVGTGDACLVTIIDRRFSYKRQFGDTASTSAFIDMYGLGVCEGTSSIPFISRTLSRIRGRSW